MGSFGEIFYRNLIAGGSYLTILKGLFATLEISVLSLIVGTVLGALLCWMRVCKIGILRGISTVIIEVLRGTPVLMLLMLMYYVILAKSGLDAPIIAVFAFSINVSAHIAELMRTVLLATDKMQVEAARTLGFSGFAAFRLITLPQATKMAKPVFKSTIVNLVQWTSVVGYVSITDLTRVVNNIGSRTMQPLFMIVVGMLIYLGIAYLTYGLFALSDKISANRLKRRQAQ